MSDSSSNKKPESDRVYITKARKCLMCRKEFKSAWSGERVCNAALQHITLTYFRDRGISYPPNAAIQRESLAFLLSVQ